MNKHGQIEMIGLLLIVFLLAIGMLFLVSTSNKEIKDAKAADPQNIGLAQDTIDAIKYQKLDCPPPFDKKIRIDDLIRDMVTDERLSCRAMSSKDYVNKTISNILNATLNTWDKPYYFTIIKNEKRADEKEYLRISYGNCTEGVSGDPGSQPSPLRGGEGTVTMTLFICD